MDVKQSSYTGPISIYNICIFRLQFKSKSDKGLTDRSLENEKAKRVEAESLANPQTNVALTKS